MSIARQVGASGRDAAVVAAQLAVELADPGLRIVFVFSDWRLDPDVIAGTLARRLDAPIVGGTTIGAIGPGVEVGAWNAVALGLYGDWVRVGIGLSTELPKHALAGGRDALDRAAQALRIAPDQLTSERHVGITLMDGTSGQEEAFCIGSAVVAPQIRMIGGCASTEIASPRRARVWLGEHAHSDAGMVVLLESALPFVAVTSEHLVPTDARAVVTSASGRVVHELDGHPAVTRLRQLITSIGDELDEPRPSHTFARYLDQVPYVRSITHLAGDDIHLASAVEAGHVLRVMRPGDLIGATTRDLELVQQRVGGTIGALLAFSCIGRHAEARSRGVEAALAESYARHRAVGLQSYGEQTGMILVNHTLTGLAIGGEP